MSNKDLLIWRKEHNRNSSAVLLVSDGNVLSSSYYMQDLTIPEGSLYVDRGGKVLRLDVNSAGSAFVASGGIIASANIKSGGSIETDKDGICKFAVISDGGKVIVESSGRAINTEVSSGANIILKPDALNASASMHSGALVNGFMADSDLIFDETYFSAYRMSAVDGVLFYGQEAVSCNVASGGSMTVSSGGLASDTTILESGHMTVMDGGYAEYVSILSSGRLEVRGAADVTGVVILESGAGIDTTSGASVEIVDVRNSCIFNANAGAVIVSAIAREGGVINVGSGASTSDAIARSGGTVSVFESGAAEDLTVSNGGSVVVGRKANVEDLVVSSAGTASIFGYCSYGVIKNAGTMIVGSGGSLDYTVVSNGGVLNMLESGSAVNTVISMQGLVYVSSGGTIASANVKNGGIISLTHNASALSIFLSSNGRLLVDSYSEARSLFIYSGAVFTVANGGLVHSTDIDEKTVGSVYLSGHLRDVDIMSGGTVSVYENGDIANINVYSGGYLELGDNPGCEPSCAVVSVHEGGSLFVGGGTKVSGVVVQSGAVVNSGFELGISEAVMAESFSLSGFYLPEGCTGYVMRGQNIDNLNLRSASGGHLIINGANISGGYARVHYYTSIFVESSGCLEDITFSGSGWIHVGNLGSVKNISAGVIYVSDGGYAENASAGYVSVFSGGRIAISNKGDYVSMTIASGGTWDDSIQSTVLSAMNISVIGGTVRNFKYTASGASYCTISATGASIGSISIPSGSKNVSVYISSSYAGYINFTGMEYSTLYVYGGAQVETIEYAALGSNCHGYIKQASAGTLTIHPASGGSNYFWVYDSSVVTSCIVRGGTFYADENSLIDSMQVTAGFIIVGPDAHVSHAVVSGGYVAVRSNVTINSLTVMPGMSINGFVNTRNIPVSMTAESGTIFSRLNIPSGSYCSVYAGQTALSCSIVSGANMLISGGILDTISVCSGAVIRPSGDGEVINAVIGYGGAISGYSMISCTCSSGGSIYFDAYTDVSSITICSGGIVNNALIYVGNEPAVVGSGVQLHNISVLEGSTGALQSGMTMLGLPEGYLHDCSLYVHSGGALISAEANMISAVIRADSGGMLSCITANGLGATDGSVAIYNNGVISAVTLGYDLTILSGGILAASYIGGSMPSSKGVQLSGITVNNGTAMITSGVLLQDLHVGSSGIVSVNSVGTAGAALNLMSDMYVYEPDGHLYIGENNKAYTVSVVSGGTLTVCSGALVAGLTADPGAVIISSNGAVIHVV